MIILLMVITIVIFIILLVSYDYDELAVFPFVAFFIELIALVCCLVGLVNMRIINQKIDLYKTQNKAIEKKVETTVKNYMEYEGSTFKELKGENYIQLVNLYPELKADKLVQQQIDLYLSNNKKIIELKEEKLKETIYKWWIYFGK